MILHIGNFLKTLILALNPSSLANSSSDKTFSIPRAKALGFLGGTNIPASPKISETPPTSVATMGFPQAMASITAIGAPSLMLG